MMPEHAKLFESPVQRLRPGGNVQLTGSGGVYTVSARPVPAVEEAVEEEEATHPFLCPDRAGDITVVGGTVNGVAATNLTPTVSSSGTQHVYLDVTYAQDLSSNNYVMGFSGAISCAIGTGGSVPSDSSTHLYRLIATYVDGVKTLQAITTSMEVVIRDDGSGGAVSTAIWGTS